MTALFASLFEQCLDCGSASCDARCPSCRTPSDSRPDVGDSRIGARAVAGVRTGHWVLTHIVEREAWSRVTPDDPAFDVGG